MSETSDLHKLSKYSDLETFYENEQEVITFGHIKQIAYELGLITLAWPTIETAVFENRSRFPKSYTENTHKEKLALLYAENFRRQFVSLFPLRRPILLAADNECGLQVGFFFGTDGWFLRVVCVEVGLFVDLYDSDIVRGAEAVGYVCEVCRRFFEFRAAVQTDPRGE